MEWQKVRELYPNQFLLVSILNFREENDKKLVDEVLPIRTISEKEVNKEFFKAKEGTIVYHTSNEDFIIHIRKDPLVKVRRI